MACRYEAVECCQGEEALGECVCSAHGVGFGFVGLYLQRLNGLGGGPIGWVFQQPDKAREVSHFIGCY